MACVAHVTVPKHWYERSGMRTFIEMNVVCMSQSYCFGLYSSSWAVLIQLGTSHWNEWATFHFYNHTMRQRGLWKALLLYTKPQSRIASLGLSFPALSSSCCFHLLNVLLTAHWLPPCALPIAPWILLGSDRGQEESRADGWEAMRLLRKTHHFPLKHSPPLVPCKYLNVFK